MILMIANANAAKHNALNRIFHIAAERLNNRKGCSSAYARYSSSATFDITVLMMPLPV